MNTIKELLVNGGYVSVSMVSELEKDFPNLKVCIKWGQAERQLTNMGDLKNELKKGLARGDYAREVFVPFGPLDTLKGVFGITEQDQDEYYNSIA